MKNHSITGLSLLLNLWLAVFGATFAFGENVNLAWDPSPASDLLGYRIYYGTQSAAYTDSIDIPNVTQATVPSLTVGVTYYFAATAVTLNGMESDFSNEVSYTVPGAPAAALAMAGDNNIGLILNGQGSPSGTYAVLSSTNGGDWAMLSTVTADDSGAFAVYVGKASETLRPGVTYHFALADNANVTSPWLSEVDYTVPYPAATPSFTTAGDAMTGLVLNVSGSPWAVYDILVSTNQSDWASFATADADASGTFAVYAGKPGQSLVPGATYYFMLVPHSAIDSNAFSQVSWAVPYPVSLRVIVDPVVGVILNCRGVPGATYQVLTSTDRRTWSVLGTGTADEDGKFAIFAGKPDGMFRFYRLEAVAVQTAGS